MKTKMAAKFQNVCSNLTDINYHMVWCEQLCFVLGYGHGSFRIYVGNIYSSKSDGTQVSLLFGSNMAAKTQNGCRQCVAIELTIAPFEQSRENWMLV